MSNDDWLRSAPAIGLILILVLGLGIFLGRIDLVDRAPSRGQAACVEGDYIHCDTSPRVLDPLTGEYGAADPNEESFRNEYRGEADLRAQRDMAFWAMGMFFATVAGVILIYNTWKESVKAAKFAANTLDEAKATTAAANETTTVTRLVGEAQSRAYLNIEDLKIEFIIEAGESPDLSGGIVVHLHFRVKNRGQTPAYRPHYVFYGDAYASEVDGCELKEQRVHGRNKNIGPNQEVDETFNLGNWGLTDEFLERCSRGRCAFSISIRGDYYTVFPSSGTGKKSWNIPRDGFEFFFDGDVASEFFSVHDMRRDISPF